MENEAKKQPPQIDESEMKMPTESTFGRHDHESPSHLGPILGVLIVLLVLILGGLYLWGSTLMDNAIEEAAVENLPTTRTPTEIPVNNEPENANARAEVEALETVSTSDEIEAIEADIDATNLDSLDAELDAIDAELDAALNSI